MNDDLGKHWKKRAEDILSRGLLGCEAV